VPLKVFLLKYRLVLLLCDFFIQCFINTNSWKQEKRQLNCIFPVSNCKVLRLFKSRLVGLQKICFT